MKIKKFKFKQIFKLHLLNSKAYEYYIKKPTPSSQLDSNITKILSDFKRVLHVTYQFHNANKKILFIGMPKRLEMEINKFTAHSAVPASFDLQGILLNNLKQSKKVRINSQSSSTFYSRLLQTKLSKRPDLIVLLASDKKQNIINESFVAKVPVIILEAENISSEFLAKSSYNVQSIGVESGKSLICLGFSFLFKAGRKDKLKY